MNSFLFFFVFLIKFRVYNLFHTILVRKKDKLYVVSCSVLYLHQNLVVKDSYGLKT